MASSDQGSEYQKLLLAKVLYNYCNDEIIRHYENEGDATKEKILGALKTVFHNFSTRELASQLQFETHNKYGKSKKSVSSPKTSGDPLLQMVLKSMGLDNIMIETETLKTSLKNWGKKKPLMMALCRHNISYQLQKQSLDNHAFHLVTSNSTYTSTANVCADFSVLKQISIRDLKLFQSATGKYVEGKLITPPRADVGITTYFEDDQGDVVMLDLYNMVPLCKEKIDLAEMKFPLGTKMKISQPYYKIFADGNLGIRVDSPEEIYIRKDKKEQNFEEIREQGKTLMQAGDYMSAFEIYVNALSKYKDIVTLLNNRAQAELKLEENETALLDSAAVLFIDHENIKARHRYKRALECLGYNFNSEDKFSTWTKILSNGFKVITRVNHGSREEGNKAFKEGEYMKAKQQYTAAIDDSEICIILNNISVLSLKCKMYHTTIAAASACLQIASNPQYRKKARFLMTKAFFMSGQLELARLSAGKESSLKPFTQNINVQEFARCVVEKKMLFSASGLPPKNWIDEIKDLKFHQDFIIMNTIQQCYIAGKGRGITAKRDIKMLELLLVDLPLSCKEKVESMQYVSSVNSNRKSLGIKAYLDLARMVLSLVKYDGLLAKKLLMLDYQCEKVESDIRMPLVDLEWMAYQTLSVDIPPFLPQSPIEVGVDRSKLSAAFLEKIIQTNAFDWGSEKQNPQTGIAVYLRISLFNHSMEPTCFYFRVGDSTFVFASKDIKAGEELTIRYSEDPDVLKNWGL